MECRQVGGTEIAERSHGSAEPGRGFVAAAQHPVAGRATRPQAAEGPCRPRGNAGAPTSSTPLADTVTARPVKSSTYGSPTVKDSVIELGPDAGQPASCAVLWAAVHAVSAWAGRPLPMVSNKAAPRTTPALLRRTEDMSPLLPGAPYGCAGNVQEVQPHGNKRSAAPSEIMDTHTRKHASRTTMTPPAGSATSLRRSRWIFDGDARSTTNN